MNAVIFLGPTLSVAEARKILPEARYLPPAQAGDVRRCVEDSPAVIGIIDGLFEQARSVWHKEILHALSRGIHVYGSSSMGALRAAEMSHYGMIGVGRVFESYMDGTLEDDDEVAVNHATSEFDFRQLSEAMVNLRDGLRRARESGDVSAEAEDLLVSAAKRLHYSDRCWPAVYAAGREAGVSADELGCLERFVAEHRPNVKRDDALRLLERVAEHSKRELAPFQPAFDFERTYVWEMLEQSLGLPSAAR